jgi:uncharacterized membrane protein YhaH (DUF805 family)
VKSWLLIGLGVLLVLVGAVWTLQGLGYVGGSFMSGASQWTVIGLVTVVVGLALAVPALLRRLRDSGR